MEQIFADLHCDTITTLYDRIQEGNKGTLLCNDLQLDIQKMETSQYLLQNFAIFFDRSKQSGLMKEALRRIDFFQKELAKNKDRIRQVTSCQEIEQNRKEGMISALLTLEGGEILEGNVDNLLLFYKKGVRMLTLTWNYENELGHSHLDTKNRGLTAFGAEVIEQMEALHMIPDVSHGSDALFYDVSRVAKKPFVASHSNARAVHGHSRNLTDGMIRTLAEKGGIMGVNFFAGFVSDRSREDGICYLSDIIRHMKHIYQVGGIECLALGSDFDGIDTDVEWQDASGMELLLHAMQKAGFTGSECDKILRDNVLRLYKECL